MKELLKLSILSIYMKELHIIYLSSIASELAICNGYKNGIMNELTINLDNHIRKPLYEQIYDYIKIEIQKGSIPSQEKLPSTRALSAHLQVSRSTVDLAYEQLLSEGYIESLPCKGYYVCELEGLIHIADEENKKEEQSKLKNESYDFDFTPNGIGLFNFPYNALRKISKEVLLEEKNELFLLGDPMGEMNLRTAIVSYLHQARGVVCSPDQIIIGAGTDYILMLLHSILGMNHTIAMENPTYKKAYDVFQRLKYPVVSVNMDKYGMDISKLKDSGADIAYVMPSHQYPLGIVMPMKRRLELINWANEKENRYIIEDDYDSEFRYKGKPIPSLQGCGVGDKVIYIGTFSKSFAPSIRLGYMVLPDQLLDSYIPYKKVFSSPVSRVNQNIMARFIREGYFERHLNKMRTVYKSKHDLLLQEMRKIDSVREILGGNAGVHILVRVDNNLSEKDLIQKAARQKVRVYGLSDYYVQGQYDDLQPTIMMGYANLHEDEIIQAVARLKEAWDES